MQKIDPQLGSSAPRPDTGPEDDQPHQPVDSQHCHAKAHQPKQVIPAPEQRGYVPKEQQASHSISDRGHPKEGRRYQSGGHSQEESGGNCQGQGKNRQTRWQAMGKFDSLSQPGPEQAQQCDGKPAHGEEIEEEMEKGLLHQETLRPSDDHSHQPQRAAKREEEQQNCPVPQLDGQGASDQPAALLPVKPGEVKPGESVEGGDDCAQRQGGRTDLRQTIAVDPKSGKAQQGQNGCNAHLPVNPAGQAAARVERKKVPDQRHQGQGGPAEIHQMAVGVADGRIVDSPGRHSPAQAETEKGAGGGGHNEGKEGDGEIGASWHRVSYS